MRKVLLALGAAGLSLCFALPIQMANSARISNEFTPLSGATKPAGTDESTNRPTILPQMPSEVIDSDEFLQRTIRTGPERDNTQKI